MSAIREQNIQVAAGTIGASPSNSPLQLSVNAQGRLTTEQEFADIILKLHLMARLPDWGCGSC